jgi:DNA-binding transcriptional MerR regulator/methylmalonyl-CoA mutase cobalamin-binding subunit
VRAVIARTGLSADVLRAWERRYGAVRPRRSPGGQRLYTEEDVARLALLRRATAAGQSISEIARLDLPALEALVEGGARARGGSDDDAADEVAAAAISATERLDAAALEGTLRRAALGLGGTALVDHVLSRFLRRVGDRWHGGTLSPAHEHLASAAVRRVLAWVADSYAVGARAPRLVVATPAGELHELGAMLAAAAAAEEGWRVVYLGASLPAPHIAGAAEQSGARAVALSAVHDADDALPGELREAARLLPRGVPLLAGGAAAARHAESLRDSGVRVLADIPALRRALRALRASASADAPADVPAAGA